MKQFKIIDFWVNTGLIISSVIISILERKEDFLHNYFFAGYFIVGGWQVISMLVHVFNRCFTARWTARYIYHWITFIAIVTMPGSFWVLLYAAPFMAVYYTYLCYQETYVKMKRPLSILK
ncbi:hypothetical protein [Ferruginibacter sp. SUN106]|uniref:hypothetical protein n=1 Tax=Ferruginibacter sp. SUN106 TaxID=2978348 RepID=UPI003D367562